jgi:hypothetical protein
VADEYVIPEPEPKEIDERPRDRAPAPQLNAVLKDEPQGEEHCANCLYFEDTAAISYCWHPAADPRRRDGGASGEETAAAT